MRRIGNLLALALLTLPLLGCSPADGVVDQQAFIEPQQVQGLAAIPTTGGSYALLTLAGEFGVEGDGSFEVGIPADFPSLALLMDEQDRILLLGFLTPHQGPQALDSKTTAVALLYFSLGGFTLPGNELQNFLELLGNDPATPPVVDLLKADPQALANGDASLLAALAEARKVLLDAPKIQALELAGSRSLQANAITPGYIRLKPAERQSSIEMATQPGGTVFARNHTPRRGVLLAYRTAVTDLDGAIQEVNPPEFVGETPLPITNRMLEALTAVDRMLLDDAPWQPQSSDPVELPLDADAASVSYELVLLGASFGTGGRILSEPLFGLHWPDWAERLARLQRESLVAEFLVPVLASQAFGSSYALRSDAGPAAISRLLDLVAPTLDPYALHTLGGFQGGLRAVIEAAAADPVLGEALLREISRLLVVLKPDGSEVNLLDSLRHPFSWEDAVGAALRTLQAMVATNTVLDATDLALAETDMGGRVQALQGNRPAESWTALVGRVSLVPETAVVTRDGPIVTLRTRVVTEGLADPGLRYRWHTTGNSGTLVAVEGDGTDFETSEADVDYVADIGSIFNGSMDTVTVEVLLDGAVIGEATALIKGDTEPDNPCEEFPAGSYLSPYMAVSVSPNIVRAGELVTVAFAYDFGNPDASTDGIQHYSVWIPYMDQTAGMIVDGQQVEFEKLTTLGSGAQVTSRRLDMRNDLLFSPFALNGPDTLVGYPTGTIIVTIIPADSSDKPGWQAPTVTDTHTVMFTLQYIDPAQPICPGQVTTPLRPGNLYWLGPLVTVDWGETAHYWHSDLPTDFHAAAGVAAFKILPTRR